MYQDKEKAANGACKPIWIHMNHLVSYCATSTPGLGADIVGADNCQPSAAHSCNRQHCVFRLQKR